MVSERVRIHAKVKGRGGGGDRGHSQAALARHQEKSAYRVSTLVSERVRIHTKLVDVGAS